MHIDAGDPLVAKVTVAAVQELSLEAGVPVYAVIKAQALRQLE